MAIQQECARRIRRLQTELEKRDLDGALFAYPIDIYYFSGTRPNALLWIPTAGDPVLLVRKSLSRALAESAVADVRTFPPSRELPSVLGAARRVGLTFDVLPVQQLHFLNKVLPGCDFVDISALNRELRSIKSAWEMEKMKESAARLCAVFARIPEFLRPDMRELDLSAEIEYRARKQGCEGYVRLRAFNQELFRGIAASGESAARSGFFDGPATGSGLSSAAAHGASTAPIARNAPILVDYTGVFEGYIVDMTRMFVFGELHPEMRKAFDVALEIQDYLTENLRPGQDCAELFAGAVALAEAAGLGNHFMGAPGEQAKFVGHGVGLELDELPILAQGFQVPLQLGQTVAVEPKFAFPGKGVIGIENTFAVGPEGGTRLTRLADDLIQI
ncbi:M24 family metallopeptidase [Geoalkalibacter sp.]|uniref:M24 family metallopeptidase n=1 Tax=Geoalkalibacter sp. TaxID=3041440 RepID=UPI00272E366D|nr:Xaa-Pro peptidase family protein [Geoalkalibacter sp.]